mmetsp:Transcript_60990/g.119591  ORF Transcript_60990/g.119591 Transcript_60990/m.119591 type:complete len:317 (-) Transcript_60990:815-1765(-)
MRPTATATATSTSTASSTGRSAGWPNVTVTRGKVVVFVVSRVVVEGAFLVVVARVIRVWRVLLQRNSVADGRSDEAENARADEHQLKPEHHLVSERLNHDAADCGDDQAPRVLHAELNPRASDGGARHQTHRGAVDGRCRRRPRKEVQVKRRHVHNAHQNARLASLFGLEQRGRGQDKATRKRHHAHDPREAKALGVVPITAKFLLHIPRSKHVSRDGAEHEHRAHHQKRKLGVEKRQLTQHLGDEVEDEADAPRDDRPGPNRPKIQRGAEHLHNGFSGADFVRVFHRLVRQRAAVTAAVSTTAVSTTAVVSLPLF